MFGILLVSLGSFLSEISDSIGKKEVKLRRESLYTMGFLQLFCGTIIFAAIALFKHSTFVFSLASLPTFIPRVILEILQAHVTILAITKADRSTFSFIRVGTIPLLVIIDIALGYSVGGLKILGIAIIMAALLITFMDGSIKKAGLGFVLFSAANAAITLSLYKYNITNFNSVVADQLIIIAILVAYFFCGALWRRRENPFRWLAKPVFFTQSFAQGLGVIVESFAFSFAPASIITAAKRSTAALWAVGFGKVYFKEKGFGVKLAVVGLLSLGIALLAV